ncbi:IS110 family transposase [Companilactobacillus halodurans]|uniref:IS110 family transposase n=1 Tax=Companilactobacillus halodurans TaxID=2584183 RepID=A0A5P0ZM41_9LACO|nr:IS110 family transposase [Companilactobacillus halodurans]MQS75320.1 IS110 family transposase [Companilactobacillus halodurans]MQS97397.1 IS110 family transposase [Companilactobacillus halodurans]
MEFIFGIDVSKTTSNIAILVDGKPVKQFKINNNAKGFETLAKELNPFKEPSIIFESTGVYSRSLKNYLLHENYRFTRINPLRAKKDMDSFRHNKTDSLDAPGLAKAMSMHHYDPTELSDPIYSKLHPLERFYQEQNEDIVREKDRLHKILSITFPEIENLLSSTNGNLYWNLVQKFPSSDFVKKYDIYTLSKVVLQSTPKNMGVGRSQRIASRLIELAKESFLMTNVDYEIREARYHAHEVQRISHLKSQLISEMAELSKNLPEIKILISIPGIGIKTAVCLTAEWGDIRRFYSSNAINAFVGIDLIHYESGNYTAGEHIRKRGNAYARKILFKAILNIISASKMIPTNINLVYKRKRQSSGSKGTKKIVISAIHHLIKTIYHLVLNNEMYDTKMFSGEH